MLLCFVNKQVSNQTNSGKGAVFRGINNQYKLVFWSNSGQISSNEAECVTIVATIEMKISKGWLSIYTATDSTAVVYDIGNGKVP